MSTDRLGQTGEKIAARFLINKNFTILEQNWRFRHKEIDIIAQFKNTLHVVEVKTRSGRPLVEGRVAVNKQKQNDLIAAANAYVEQNQIELDVQFDIIEIIYYRERFYARYIPDAFYPRV